MRRFFYLIASAIRPATRPSTALLAAACALLTLSATAQSRISITGSLQYIPVKAQYQHVEERNPDPPVYELRKVKASTVGFSAGLSVDQPVYCFNPDLGLGISAAAQVGIVLAFSEEVEGFANRLLLDFPVYATFRYGARASRKSEMKSGFGMGLGYRWARYHLPFNSPSIMAEYTFYGGHFTYNYVRVSSDLGARKFYSHYSSEGLVEALRLREISLTFGHTF